MRCRLSLGRSGTSAPLADGLAHPSLALSHGRTNLPSVRCVRCCETADCRHSGETGFVGKYLAEGEIMEIVLHYQAGMSLKRIVRFTHHSRNTVRKYVALVRKAGVVPGGALSVDELRAALAGEAPWIADSGRSSRLANDLNELQQEIMARLSAATVATVWSRLRTEGRTTVSLSTFQRCVRRWRQDTSTTWERTSGGSLS